MQDHEDLTGPLIELHLHDAKLSNDAIDLSLGAKGHIQLCSLIFHSIDHELHICLFMVDMVDLGKIAECMFDEVWGHNTLEAKTAVAELPPFPLLRSNQTLCQKDGVQAHQLWIPSTAPLERFQC
jgi:hypothetical protein